MPDKLMCAVCGEWYEGEKCPNIEFGAKPHCLCGSGEPSRDLYDARGIYCTRVCGACQERRIMEFRPEIFTDSQYECDEPIEEDDY